MRDSPAECAAGLSTSNAFDGQHNHVSSTDLGRAMARTCRVQAMVAQSAW